MFFFVSIILTMIFSPCSLIIGDDPLFRGQAVTSFVGLMLDLLSADLLDLLDLLDQGWCLLLWSFFQL